MTPRPGWEQLAQSVTGMAAAEGGNEPPHLAPAAQLPKTPLGQALPPSPLGSHPAEWLPRG